MARRTRALVTGASGFVGSHLVDRLIKAGYQVRCFVRYTSTGRHGWLENLPPEGRAAIEVVAGDLRDANAVLEAAREIDAIFHLGALVGIPYSYVHPREVVDTNVSGTLNILLAARECGVGRFVHISTSEVYGSAQYTPMDEKHPLQAQSPYAASKVGAEKLVESFWASFGLPAVVLRPFNVYGPRQSGRAVIPTIISQALTQAEVQLGNTDVSRDFTYVEDTVDAFVKAAEAEEAVGRTLNVGSGVEISIARLVEAIANALGKPVVRIARDPARIRPMGSEVTRLRADSTLAQQVLGWQPRVPLDEGLRRTIAWTDANRARYRIGSYEI